MKIFPTVIAVFATLSLAGCASNMYTSDGQVATVSASGKLRQVVGNSTKQGECTTVQSVAGTFTTGSARCAQSYGGYANQYGNGYGGYDSSHRELATDPNAHCMRDAYGRATFCGPN